MRGARLVGLLGAMALSGCDPQTQPEDASGIDAPLSTDASADVTPDARVLDASALDVAVVDAFDLDAVGLDAPGLDAADDAPPTEHDALALDALALDALALDALGTDAGRDAAVRDANGDAGSRLRSLHGRLRLPPLVRSLGLRLVRDRLRHGRRRARLHPSRACAATRAATCRASASRAAPQRVGRRSTRRTQTSSRATRARTRARSPIDAPRAVTTSSAVASPPAARSAWTARCRGRATHAWRTACAASPASTCRAWGSRTVRISARAPSTRGHRTTRGPVLWRARRARCRAAAAS